MHSFFYQIIFFFDEQIIFAIMLISDISLNKKLSPFFSGQIFHPTGKTYDKHLLPNSIIVKNSKNELFIEFKCDITQQQQKPLFERLMALAELSQYEEFVQMRHFNIKQIGSQEETKFRIFIYFEYSSQQLEQLSKYVRRKKSNSNFIVSEDALFDYLYSLVKALTIIEELGYLRHGYLNLFTIYKDKEKQTFKVLFNPFYHIECIQELENNPKIEYFKNYFLSPQQLIRLSKNNKNFILKVNSKSDVYTIGIIILTLATIHLSDNMCYFEYSHRDAALDKNNLDEKFAFIAEYYSQQFVRITYLMLELDQDDRISSSDLLNKLLNIFHKRKQKQKKYFNTLLRIYGDRIYKSMNYKLKFQKGAKKGKVQQLEIGGQADNDSVFRGTFGNDQKAQGYYGLPSSEKHEQQEQQIPQKIQKKKTPQKKAKPEKKHQPQTHDYESTEKKKHKHKSGPQKISAHQDGLQPHPIVDLESKFSEYESKSSPKFNTKPSQKIMTKLQTIVETEKQKSSQSKVVIQDPSFQYFPQDKFFSTIINNPENQEKLLFEVQTSCFPSHILQFFGCKVPERKYFKPLSAQQLARKFNSQGIMISKNIYYGSCKQGRREGLGLNIFPEGEYYYGYYDQDLQHGQGVYWWNPSQYFIGQFHYGKKLKGWMINGTKTFAGKYLNNQKTGFGVNFEQNCVFQGSWENGKRQGQGIIFFNNGDMFRGVWRNGKKNGMGIQKKYFSKIKIQGEWKDDQQVHPVEVRYPNKHIFKGQYRNGKKTGKGQYYFHNGTKFSGVFQDDDCYEGSFHFADNSIYYGKVSKALKREGFGTNIDQNGDKYEGEWLNDQKHGNGKYETTLQTMTGIWKEGSLWEGSIVDSMGNYFKVEYGKMKKPTQYHQAD